MLVCWVGLAAAAGAQPADRLPELVEISPSLHTAAQPSAPALDGLAAQGYTLVVNLAPPDAPGAVLDEAQRLTLGGLSYVNIPVAWQQPTTADFALFSAVLHGAGMRKTLVHCALNRRASVFTFLYRVVHENVPPARAYEDVTRVWTPNETWRSFAQEILTQHAIPFDFNVAP
jgi:protein tyrosine phosphatase (PTP) superfamily phosphohydrolase (DUF442 family)